MEQTREMKAAWTRSIHQTVAQCLLFLAPEAVRLVVAHLALESGFGSARAAMRGLNLGNITAGSAWKGGKWVDVGGDTNAKGARITQTWRTYGSVQEFLADYWSFLGPHQNSGRYTLARNMLERGRLDDAARLLYAAGYFELEPTEYARRLRAALDAVLLHLEAPRPPAVPPVVPVEP